MPRKYEAMRDKFMREGMTRDAAQKKAAKIYNAQRKPGEPAVGGDTEESEDWYPEPGHEMKFLKKKKGKGREEVE